MTIKDDIVVELQTQTGPMRTFVFRPAAEGKFPGVVLFSEIFQVTAPIRRTAAMIAGQGYVVAVPEVYHELEPAGTVLAYDQQGADVGNAHKYAKEVSAYDADARAVLDHDPRHPNPHPVKLRDKRAAATPGPIRPPATWPQQTDGRPQMSPDGRHHADRRPSPVEHADENRLDTS